MLFHSIQFIVFVTAVFFIYWSIVDYKRIRTYFLLTASFVFYAAWNPIPILIIVWCSTFDYFCALGMGYFKSNSHRKMLVVFSVISNLLVLCFFKYAELFYQTATEIMLMLGYSVEYSKLGIILPIGLSFVIFQTLSYTIDVYRGDLKPRKSWAEVTLFISFFPQIVAGPIVRAAWFFPQLDKEPELTKDDGNAAILRISKGLVKKLLIADLLASNLVDRVFENAELYSSLETLAAVVAYTLQIYYDFSAYSDIAIGAAALFGFKIKENFNRPYKAHNLFDFWRRWHISLSTWLRDYLYIPMGGNRGSKFFICRNIMITMILGGLWHGPTWRMALWGFIHGALLVLTKFSWWIFGKPPKDLSLYRKIFTGFLTFAAVALARIFFRAQSMDHAFAVFKQLADGSFSHSLLTPLVIFVMIASFVIHLLPQNLYDKASKYFIKVPVPVRAAALVALAIVIKNVVNFEAQPFIYFQF